MSDKTKPALTPKEWGEFLKGFSGVDEVGGGLHGTAAACLHGQPFGFTREDVNVLRLAADVKEIYGKPEVHEANAEWFRNLADRIEALLPPAEEVA